MIIPCKDCLILPLCKNKPDKTVTSCILLQKWWYRDGATEQYGQDLIEIQKYLPIGDTDRFTKDPSKW